MNILPFSLFVNINYKLRIKLKLKTPVEKPFAQYYNYDERLVINYGFINY